MRRANGFVEAEPPGKGPLGKGPPGKGPSGSDDAVATLDPAGMPSDLEFRSARDGSRGAFVHQAIRAAIRDGELKAGQRLRERDVAEWLGVSRTPVREAFRMLQGQGMLAEAAGDGLVVSTLSTEEIGELYEVWADLEGLAARYAARHASMADIRTMTEACQQWDPDLSARELGLLNHRLHRAVYAGAQNRFLSRSLAAIEDSLALLGFNTFLVPGRPAEAGREHLEIVRAISQRDPDAAYEAARNHILTAGQRRRSLSCSTRSTHPAGEL